VCLSFAARLTNHEALFFSESELLVFPAFSRFPLCQPFSRMISRAQGVTLSRTRLSNGHIRRNSFCVITHNLQYHRALKRYQVPVRDYGSQKDSPYQISLVACAVRSATFLTTAACPLACPHPRVRFRRSVRSFSQFISPQSLTVLALMSRT